MLDLEVKLNLNEEQWGKLVWEEVSVVKFDLKKGFIQHTESLLKMVRASRRQFCLPPPCLDYVGVSAFLVLIGLGQPVPGRDHSDHSLHRHPPHGRAGQEQTVLWFLVWQVNSSPSQILQPVAGPGQCWAFSGQVVRVTGVTIEYVRPSPDMSSAPHDMLV